MLFIVSRYSSRSDIPCVNQRFPAQNNLSFRSSRAKGSNWWQGVRVSIVFKKNAITTYKEFFVNLYAIRRILRNKRWNLLQIQIPLSRILFVCKMLAIWFIIVYGRYLCDITRFDIYDLICLAISTSLSIDFKNVMLSYSPGLPGTQGLHGHPAAAARHCPGPLEDAVRPSLLLHYIAGDNRSGGGGITRADFLSLARSKLRLCSANHGAGYFSNLACDWQSIVWAYFDQETENVD